MEGKYIIAFDIGGTSIKHSCVSPEGTFFSSGDLPTEAEKGVEVLVSKIESIIQKNLSEETLGIAISATGQIDFYQGKVVGGNPIIPGWIGCELVKRLEKKYSLPCVLENDVNCAALGEAWLGAGKEEENFLCLTIGTGIGGGIILNHDLYRGISSVAGEFGKLSLENKKGSYETHASMTALLEQMERKTGRFWNGEKIFKAYWAEEGSVVEVVDLWIENFAEGLVTLLYIWNPSCMIIGGGVTHQGEPLRKKIEEALQKKITANYWDQLTIKFATLGNHAGLLGASFLLLEKIKTLGGK